MDHRQFIAQIQRIIKEYSYDTLSAYIEDIGLAIQKDIAPLCPDARWINHNGFKSLLFLRQYDLQSAPNDITRGSILVLDFVSLFQEPGYAFACFCLANHSRDLYEETSEILHMERSIQLMQQWLEAEEQGSAAHLAVAAATSFSFMHYYIREDAEGALEEGMKLFKATRQKAVNAGWISSFGMERTLFVVGETLCHRYAKGGSGDDLTESVQLLLDILNLFTPQDSFCFTTLDTLVLSTIFNLARTIESHEIWLKCLSGLHDIVRVYILGESNGTDLPDVLFETLDACLSAPTSRAACVLHIADLFHNEGKCDDLPYDQFCSDDDVTNNASLWVDSWEDDRRGLREAISNGYISPHLVFRFKAILVHRPITSGRILFRTPNPVEVHECSFRFEVFPMNGRPDTMPQVSLDHTAFIRVIEKICKPMSRDQLSFYINDIREFNPPVFSAVPRQWTQSPCIRACLLKTRYLQNRHYQDFKELGSLMLTVHLEREPGYSNILCFVANEYRDEETVMTSVDIAAPLFQEYVKVQVRGSPGHFLGVVGLASTLMLSSFHHEAAVTLAASLEILREALPSGASWFTARKTVILGRMLNYRVRHFSASDDALTKSIPILTRILDLLPPQPPPYVSILELLVVSTALALSQRVSGKDWHDAITLLAKGLELYVSRNVASSDGKPESSNSYSKKELDTLNLLFNSSLDGLYRFTLGLEAMCLIHMADVLQYCAFDVSRHPQSLLLSFKIYQRSLRLPLSSKLADDAQFLEQNDLKWAWEDEREALRKAITASVHHTIPPVDSLPKSSYTFEYRVLREGNIKSSEHKCIFRYYPIEGHQETFDDARVGLHDLQLEKKFHLPWPEDLMALPASSDSSVPGLPTSSIIPGIDKFLSSNENVLFLPLEQRTIKALLRHLGSEVRHTEGLVFDATETLINQSSRRFYMDPSELVLETRMRRLKDGSAYLARAGPIQALISKGPEKCLELVDRSRALFWTRLLRLRTSFDGLPEGLAQQLQQTAIELDHCKGQVNSSVSKAEAKEQMKLETSFERLVDQARAIPEFKDFLLPKTYDVLMKVASEGPVVVLIGNSSTYAALLIRQSGIDAIYLSTLTEDVLEKLLIGIQQANRMSRSILQEEEYVPEQERGGKPKISTRSLPAYAKMLSGLWQHITKPVLDRLGATSNADPMKRTRLWWCPTGPFGFLPLHAAGIGFGTPNVECVSTYAVSSYTPTISALLSARSKPSTLLSSQLKMLVLAQPTTKGHTSLPMTVNEVKVIEQFTPPNQLLRLGEAGTPLTISNSNRTVEDATIHLAQTSILHLACHGNQDRGDPLNSGFELEDGRLTLAKLIGCQTPNAFLAFLSACESASNDLSIPDETLNLAAAMIYAGFRSVIGTMWTMDDNDGPEIAQTVYEELFKDPDQEVDPKLIPYALDLAVRRLQEKGVHPSRWATYIHLGV